MISNQKGAIGTVIVLILVGVVVLVGWKAWEATQIQIQTGKASEIAASSNLSITGTVPNGYSPYIIEKLPISFVVPSDYEVTEGRINNRNDKAIVNFKSPEGSIAVIMTASEPAYEDAQAYVSAISEGQVNARSNSATFRTVGNNVQAAQIDIEYSNKERIMTYFVHDGFEFKFEISKSTYNTNSVARAIYSQIISSINTRTIE